MEGQKIIAGQTDENQNKAEDITLEKRIKGIAEQTEEEKKMKKSKNGIKHSRNTGIFYLGLHSFAAVTFFQQISQGLVQPRDRDDFDGFPGDVLHAVLGHGGGSGDGIHDI
jgi:hypothetical protein